MRALNLSHVPQLIFLGLIKIVTCLELRSYISDQGLHGKVSFKKTSDGIEISTELNPTLEYPNQVWSWSINEFPVDYTDLENRCQNNKIGKSFIDLDAIYGYLIIPDNQTSTFFTKDLKINGHSGIYGKSLLLKNVENNRKICSTITIVEKNQEKTAIARFNSPISGNVYFRWFSTKDSHGDMLIMSDLYHVSNRENNTKNLDFTEHNWKIYVTDILDTDSDRSENNCNILQLVFDPEHTGNGNATGDIDSRLGKIKLSNNNKIRYKTLFRDEKLILLPSDLTGPQRRLYLVIFEQKHPDTFLACAKIRYEHPVTAK